MIEYVAGVDIGNASTETALGKIEDGKLCFCVSGIAATTGIKGTKDNVAGIRYSLLDASKKMGIDPEAIQRIQINEATPVIGDFAMETITETIITESTLIGHNPDTPGGLGIGAGISIAFSDLLEADKQQIYIPVIPEEVDFAKAAQTINEAEAAGINIAGAILKNDDGVLVSNRLNKKIPIVDEVDAVDRIPMGMLCAVEVATEGGSIDLLANPYGIATLFNLDAEKTKQVVHIAKALIGNRSAVVIKTPEGEVEERNIPAGALNLHGETGTYSVDVDKGSTEIMKVVKKIKTLQDVTGTRGTNVGGMLENVRKEMAELTEQAYRDVRIRDLMAVDTIVPNEISGNLAHEFSMEKAVGIAAMVQTHKLQMEGLASTLSQKLNLKVDIGGVEGDMAIIGALTTPGTAKPLVTIDIGAGSTDACLIGEDGQTQSVHLAGAGNMVTMLIGAELGIGDFGMAEDIKKYPLAKVESLYHIRHEDGSVEYFTQPIESRFFARTIALKPQEWTIVNSKRNMERIRQVRREAKEKVLIHNIVRVLEKLSLTGNLNDFDQVVLVGGSSLDFELGNMVTDTLSYYGIVSGKANIRKTEGPRNAVATGLLLSYMEA